MAVDIKSEFQELIRRILGDREVARAYVSDPEGTLAEVGVTSAELTPDEVRAMVEEACRDIDLSPQVRAQIDAYVSSSPPPAATQTSAPPPPPATAPATQPPVEMVQQHLNYVTYASYEGDEYITQEITNIDNSSDINVDVGEHNDGDITIDVDNVTATQGGVAAGENATVEDVVTGDGAVQLNDNASLNDSVINTGQNSGNIVGDMDDSSIVSGNEVGGDVVSIGDVDDAALGFGEGNVGNVSDVSQGDDSNIGQNTGSGINQTDTSDTAAAQGGGSAFGDVDDAAVTVGSGASSNVSDLDDGSAGVIGDGSATGSDVNDAFNNNTDSAFEQGAGDQTVEDTVDVNLEVNVPEPPADPLEGVDL